MIASSKRLRKTTKSAFAGGEAYNLDGTESWGHSDSGGGESGSLEYHVGEGGNLGGSAQNYGLYGDGTRNLSGMVELVDDDVDETASQMTGQYAVSAHLDMAFDQSYDGAGSYFGSGYFGSVSCLMASASLCRAIASPYFFISK